MTNTSLTLAKMLVWAIYATAIALIAMAAIVFINIGLNGTAVPAQPLEPLAYVSIYRNATVYADYYPDGGWIIPAGKLKPVHISHELWAVHEIHIDDTWPHGCDAWNKDDENGHRCVLAGSEELAYVLDHLNLSFDVWYGNKDGVR